MSGHRHDHSCEGEHQHDESPEMGVQYSLYTKIDKMNMECLNEAAENSGKDVFKPWEQRLSLDKVTHTI
jgi:nucleoside-specific outer membrane channel protein Tsx